jgi:hypothetical protein
MSIASIRAVPARFGIVFRFFLTTLLTGSLFAQQYVRNANDACGTNSDCSSYKDAVDQLLHGDEERVATPGKKPENRSHTLLMAESYLQQHAREAVSASSTSYASRFRYLSCVSSALWAERGGKKTLFSAENIIETYFAVAGPDGQITVEIQHTCELLGKYHSRLDQARDERAILQGKNDSPDPQGVWHAILVDCAKREVPRQNAELTVKQRQGRYCLFAMECRAAENSPFPKK